MHLFKPRFFRVGGFTLTELMMALGIAVLGGAIVYPILVSDLQLYTKNFSINKSNNSLRYSLQMLKKDIDMAIEPPILMSYNVSGGTGVLTPANSSAVSSQALMLWDNLGPAYDLVPTSATVNANGTVTQGNSTTVTTSTAIKLLRSPGSVLPQVGDRLLILSPSPYSTGMADTVMMNSVSITKPGRLITACSLPTSNYYNVTSFTVNIDQTNPLPAGITGNQSVYIIREVAYAVNTINDSTGKAAERDLVYYSTTANMGSSRLLIRDLDPMPQEIDPNTNATIQPFNYYGSGRATLSFLSLNLPVRSLDYAHAIADHNLGAQTTDTSSTEFNLYLRSNVQMGMKVRLD